MRCFVALALTAALCVPTPLLAAAIGKDTVPLTLGPSSPWNADFGDESCALKRVFGEGKDRVMLELRKFGPVKQSQLTIMGPSLKPGQDGFSYRFNDAESANEAKRYIARRFAGGFEGIATTAIINPADFGDGRNERLLIEKGFSQAIALQTGDMSKPIEVLRHCTKNLLRVWGVTESVDAERPKMAQPTNLEKIRRELLKKFTSRPRTQRKSGQIRLRLMIDSTGKPTSCHVQAPTEVQDLDEKACRIVMRFGEFLPGANALGEPVASYYLLSPTFRKH